MKNKIKYLNAVADYLVELGYEVSEPTLEHDLLDVWGICKNKRCYVEIYLVHYSEDIKGSYGIWSQGENEDEELFLSNDPIYSLDVRFAPMLILDDLKPFKKVKGKQRV